MALACRREHLGLSEIIPSEETVLMGQFHRQVAYQLLFWSMVHTTAHYVNFINVERTQVREQTAAEIHYAQPGGITGHTYVRVETSSNFRHSDPGRMLLIMFLMYTTAHAKIRKQCFEAFWYTHHLVSVRPPSTTIDDAMQRVRH
jgi:NADPH oxidase